MAFPSTSLINSEIDSALFFHKKYKKFGTKMIDIMSKIMPEIDLSFFSAIVLSERATSMTYPASSLSIYSNVSQWGNGIPLCYRYESLG
mgnify:CR=1 FL=1